MARKRQRILSDDTHDEGVNLTPLIDVVFIVLITFILIAPLVELDRIQLACSSAGAQKEKVSLNDELSLAIYVNAEEEIMINKRKLTLKELAPLLKEFHRKKPDAPIRLFHDRHASFGMYQSVKNSVEAAGFNEMDVILLPG